MKTLLINNSPFLFLNLFLILLFTNAEIFQCITLEKTKFQKMIMKNQKIIQSTRIENYLRKLVLQNNEIGDKDLVFLEKEDLDVNPKDINFILQDDSDEDELRARLFSFKYGKINQKEKNFVPLTCEKSKEIVAKGWKAYDILLIGDKNENLVIKICLNENKELNFAVSVKINENCKEYIDKIEELKIINIE